MSLGEAFITVRADTSGFQADLDAKLKAAIAQVDAANKLAVATSSGSTSTAADQAASNARRAIADAEVRAYREDAARTVADAKAAQALQTADLQAAVAARRAVISAEARAYQDAARIERAALADAGSGAESLAVDVDKAAASTDGLNLKLRDLQIPALVAAAALAVVAAAALGAATAAAIAGVKGAEGVRSLTLSLEDSGESATAAKAQIAALQALADQGLNLTALAADQKILDDLGLSAKTATALLRILGDVFAGEGFVGAALQSQVDAATKSLAAAVAAGAATKDTIATVADALGISQAQIRAQLGLTSKALDDEIAKGKLSGAAVANAGIAVAEGLKNSANGLSNALATSPTQALDALKSKIETALSEAFESTNPKLASSIDGISDHLSKALAGIAPGIAIAASDVLSFLGSHIDDITNALTGTFVFVAQTLRDAADPTSQLHKFLVDLIDDGKDIAKFLGPAVEGFVKAFAGAVEAIKPVLDLLAGIAGTDAGSELLKVAGGIGAIVLAGKGIDALTASLARLAGAEDSAAASAAGLATASTAAGTGLDAEGAGAKAAGAGGLLSKLGGASVGGVPLPILAGGAAGAGIAQLLSNKDTPAGFHGSNELSTDQFTAGLKDLQKEINSISDANLRTQLTNIAQTTLSTNDAQDRFSGALGKAQQQINSFDAAHGIAQTGDLKNAVDALTTASNDGTDAVAKLIQSGAVNAGTAGLQQIDEQLRILAADGNAAAQSIFQAERQAASLTTNLSINLADAQGLSAEDAAKARAANGGVDVNPTTGAGIAAIPTPKFAPIPSTGGSSGASSAANAAKAAATALANATATFKVSLKSFTDAIGGATTVAASNSAFDSLRSAIAAEDKALGKAEPKGLAAYITKSQKSLNDLIRQENATTALIQAGTAATTAAIASTLSSGALTDVFTAISAAATTATVDLSRLTLVLPGTVHALTLPPSALSSANAFQANLSARVTAAQSFATNIAKLKAEGLDPGALNDLIAGGVSGSGAAAAQLAGATAAQIAAINKSEVALKAAGDSIGKTAGDVAVTAAESVGQQVVSGLVQGLTAKDSALEAAATALGKKISDTIKRELKISSPSKVMHGLGVHAGEGLRLGLLSGHGAIGDAAARLASAATPDIGTSAMALRGGHGGHGGMTDEHVDRIVRAVEGRPTHTVSAPIHITNNGSADRTGELVAGAIGRLVIR